MVARPSTATQIQPDDDSPMAAAETVDFSCSREPKSWRIAMPNVVEISASLLNAFAGGGFFDVVQTQIMHGKLRLTHQGIKEETVVQGLTSIVKC